MPLPTEPIGSIPRPQALIDAMTSGNTSPAELDALFDDAVRDTIARFEDTGSPVITDGEQRKSSFVTYPITGIDTLAPAVSPSPSRTGTRGSCRPSRRVPSATAPTPAPTSKRPVRMPRCR